MFRKAERKKAKLRLGICGPAGSGKTYSALLIALGLGGKIAMIDTEHSSGELYSNMLDYDIAILAPPFTPQSYIQSIKEAEKEGYNSLIIDSLSHAWSGEGGILDMHDKAAASKRNSFTAWREVTPHHNALVEGMLQSPIHIIATMRTKTAYEMVEENGKTRPVKIGLAPVQKEGMDYEFSVVFDLAVDKHIAAVSKDRTGLFDGKYFVPSSETGKTLQEWLETGVEPAQKSKEEKERLIEQMDKLQDIYDLQNWWNKYQGELSTLMPKHKKIIVDYKDSLKDKFTRNNGKALLNSSERRA